MKKSTAVLIPLCILLLIFISIPRSDPQSQPAIGSHPKQSNAATLPANTPTLFAEYFGYEFWSYGKTKSQTVAEHLDRIESYQYFADYTKALYVQQGQKSTDFGFTISGWSTTDGIPQYSRILGIRCKLGVWTRSITGPTNGISNLRIKMELIKPGFTTQYEMQIVAGQTQNQLYDLTITFNSEQLQEDMNQGYQIHWIRVYAYTTYIMGNRDELDLDQLLVEYLYTLPTVPKAPVLTCTSGLYEPTVVLTWTEPQSDAPITSYNIYRNATLLATTTTELSYTDSSSKTLGTNYIYQIRAVSTLGASDLSNSVSILPCTVPSAPELQPIVQNSSGLILNWSVSNTGGTPITEIEIFRSVNGSDYTSYRRVPAAITHYIDQPWPDSHYSYRVRAVNVRGAGPFSERSIHSAPWSIAITPISAIWNSDYSRYTASEYLLFAFDISPGFYNSTVAQITEILINGSAVPLSVQNSTRVTTRLDLPNLGKYIFNIEMRMYGQSVSDVFELIRTDAIRGGIQFIPDPIAFGASNILSDRGLKLRMNINNDVQNLHDSSFIRLQRGQYRLDLISYLKTTGTGTINTELDLTPYIGTDEKFDLSIFLSFTDGTYFTEYREFWIDRDPPIIKNLGINRNQSIVLFEISEEFPRTLVLEFSAEGKENIVISLSTTAQFGLYPGFKNYNYTVVVNQTLFDYRILTVRCTDAVNRTVELYLLLNDSPAATMITISDDLVKWIGIVGIAAMGLAAIEKKAFNKRIKSAARSGASLATGVSEILQSVQQSVQRAATPTNIPVHYTRQLSEAELVRMRPCTGRIGDYVGAAAKIFPSLPQEKIAAVLHLTLDWATQYRDRLTMDQIWLIFIAKLMRSL